MSSIRLTRRGRFVRSLLLLAALIIVVVVLVTVFTQHPAMVTDGAWRDAKAAAQWRMMHSH